MEIKLLEYPRESDWIACKQRALVTVKTLADPDWKIEIPSEDWKHRILEARHSPIRYLRFSFYLIGVPYYVSVHLVRHVHAQPYVRSQRNDRQSDYDRTKAPQDAPVNMIWDMNAEELMVIANKRLCQTADPKTREVVHQMVNLVNKVRPEFKPFLVPACSYHGTCHEMFPCRRGALLQARDKTCGVNVEECDEDV